MRERENGWIYVFGVTFDINPHTNIIRLFLYCCLNFNVIQWQPYILPAIDFYRISFSHRSIYFIYIFFFTCYWYGMQSSHNQIEIEQETDKQHLKKTDRLFLKFLSFWSHINFKGSTQTELLSLFVSFVISSPHEILNENTLIFVHFKKANDQIEIKRQFYPKRNF